MHPIDVKTIMFLYALNEVLCCGVIAFFWMQNRAQSKAFALWVSGLFLQLVGFVLIVLRGSIPDSFSIVGATALILFGSQLLLTGIERYVGKASAREADYAVLAFISFGSVAFTYAWESIAARNILFSVGVVYYALRIATLAFARVEPKLKSAIRPVGVSALALIAVNGVRIANDAIFPDNRAFFEFGLVNTGVLVANELIALAMNFSIVLMVSRKLHDELTDELVERTRVTDELWRSKERFSRAFQNSSNAIIISVLATGEFIEVNDAFLSMTGFSREETLGKTAFSVHFWDAERDRDSVVAALTRGESVRERELRFRKKDGTVMDCIFSSQILELEQGRCILSTIQDITDRKRDEETIVHMATHDPLTNLPTLRLARDRLEIAESMAKRLERPMAVFFIDIDGFKAINDTWGHDAGDRVLKEIAARLASCVRQSDTAARIGGDEFLVVLSSLASKDDARLVAEKMLAAFSRPIGIAEGDVTVGLSVGIAVYPENGSTPDALIKAADGAMYRVKRAGKNNYEFA